MGENRKRIGVLISEIQSPYQTKVLKGIMSIAVQNGIDVLIFATFANNIDDNGFTSAETSVFSLANPDYIDGYLLFPSVIPYTVAYDRALRIIKHSDKPVICVDGVIDGFESINNNDDDDIEALTDHLIEKHGLKRIAMLTGFRGNLQAESRFNGYCRSMKKHGLRFDDRFRYYGNFWYDCAKDAVDYFENNIIPFPEAIVCANDHMAIAVSEELERRGKKVPDDVAVTGYDCDCGGITKKYTVTSVRMNAIRVGRMAAKAIIAKVKGTELVNEIESDTTPLLIRNSCGCEIADNQTAPTGILSSFEDNNGDNIFSVNCHMLEEILDMHTIRDFMWRVDWYTCLLKSFNHLSLCLSDDWMKQYENFDGNPYAERICWIYTRLTGDRHDDSVDTHRFVKKSELFPFIAENPKASAYFFLPIHSNRYSFGYFVHSYGSKIDVPDIRFSWWSRYIGDALESLRRYINQVNLNEQNLILSEEMIKTQEEIILAFAEITESKSGQTGKHVKRVSEYTRILADGMGFSINETEQIRIASMLHDIGKLMIPSEILEKPGRLTDAEFEVIKSHVSTGEQLLHNAPGEIMSIARKVALNHHEKWNGSGYRGLNGDNIDIYSRIVAVADVYDALSSKRSYKDAWEKSRVYDHIVSEKGVHFCPEVVDVFMRKYDEIARVKAVYPD